MQDRLVRISELIPAPETGKTPMIPISRSQWWEGVKRGIYPQPIKLGPRITVWRLSDIEHLLRHGIEDN